MSKQTLTIIFIFSFTASLWLAFPSSDRNQMLESTDMPKRNFARDVSLDKNEKLETNVVETNHRVTFHSKTDELGIETNSLDTLIEVMATQIESNTPYNAIPIIKKLAVEHLPELLDWLGWNQPELMGVYSQVIVNEVVTELNIEAIQLLGERLPFIMTTTSHRAQVMAQLAEEQLKHEGFTRTIEWLDTLNEYEETKSIKLAMAVKWAKLQPTAALEQLQQPNSYSGIQNEMVFNAITALDDKQLNEQLYSISSFPPSIQLTIFQTIITQHPEFSTQELTTWLELIPSRDSKRAILKNLIQHRGKDLEPYQHDEIRVQLTNRETQFD